MGRVIINLSRKYNTNVAGWQESSNDDRKNLTAKKCEKKPCCLSRESDCLS